MFAVLDEAIELLEKANTGLEPELVAVPVARGLLERYARIEKLAAYGTTVLSDRVDDDREVAKRTGTSLGKTRRARQTAKRARKTPALDDAMRSGNVSRDQAEVIAEAEESAPGSAEDLLALARRASFQRLRDEARRRMLEAEARKHLHERQHQARYGRFSTRDLGMIRIEAELEPHLGAPLVNRWEAEARRLADAARKEGRTEPFSAHLADALVRLLEGTAGPCGGRPEVVVLVSEAVATRGWRDVRHDEVCKIPGVGPIAPQAARDLARAAFISAVTYEGTELRSIKRFTRHIPVEVRLALCLGDPPEFDGVKCTDCGNRFNPEFDHVEPFAAGGATSLENLEPRCYECHQAKTERDRAAGKLRRRDGPGPP